MCHIFRWGILGSGHMARLFAADLALLHEAKVIAIGSRSSERAQEFGALYSIPNRHASYEALVSDPEVDIVYVATHNTVHFEACLLALDAGKAVLCEKPFTINEDQAAAVITRARQTNNFLMDGMWTRFFPAMTKLREWLASGRIGDVRTVVASFGFRTPFDPRDRRLNPDLGGGALLDVGVYPIALCSMILGPPERVMAAGQLGKTGVDEDCSAMLVYANGQTATIHCSLRNRLPQEAYVIGTRGYIHIPEPFWRPTRLVLRIQPGSGFLSLSPFDPDEVAKASDGLRATAVRYAKRIRGSLLRRGTVGTCVAQKLRDMGEWFLNVRRTRRMWFPLAGWGVHYEASEVMRCVRHGLRESPLMPHEESLQIMRTLDQIRREIGLEYPGEGVG